MSRASIRPFLFIHGGPGFNSNPERLLLGAPMEFWDEPSVHRGDTIGTSPRFLQSIESIETCVRKIAERSGAPVGLLAHSYGVRTAVHVCRRNPDLIDRLVLVAPALDIHAADLRVLTVSLEDFRTTDPEKASRLEEILNRIRVVPKLFSPEKLEGYLLALQNPGLFNHYWHRRLLMSQYLSWFTPPRYAFDLESFKETRFSEPPFETQEPIRTPTWLVFGEKDEIVFEEPAVAKARRLFQAFETVRFAKSGHYPHIEEQERLMQVLGR